MPHRIPHRGVAALLLLLSAAALPAQCGPRQVVEGFQNGANPSGWAFVPGQDVIEPAGGNPAEWLHNRNVQAAAPVLATPAGGFNVFAGDYRAKVVTAISLDAQTVATTNGPPLGFNLTLLLRDTKGTATTADDDFVYSVGGQVPLPLQGWSSYSFPIPSQSAALPPGWVGGWPGNPRAFRSGVDWNDVITSVDRVEVWWIDPAFSAVPRGWDVGADNLTLHTGAVTAVAVGRNGSGVNQIALGSQQRPVLGTTWRVDLDCTPVAPGQAAVILGDTPATVPAGAAGEILLAPPRILLVVVVPSAGVTRFPFLLPPDPALCGYRFSVQGLCAGSAVALSNALDALLGG